jgi:hypothetical protein
MRLLAINLYTRYTILLGMSLLLMTGCLKDTETFIPYQDNVQISAFGVVLNEQDLPVFQAMVTVEGETTSADSNGVFIFNDIVVPADLTSIKFSKEGYFDAYRTVVPGEGMPTLTVRMLHLGQDYNFNAGTGGIIYTPYDVSFTIPPNILQDGQSLYTGEVRINASYIDPLSPNLYTRLPGSPLARNDADQLGLLEHFGSVLLECRGSADESLNTTDGNFITVRIPIPADLAGLAPDSIDLWQLDLVENEWLWTNKAYKEGDFYVAKVTKEGTYSVQRHLEFTSLEGRVIDKNDQPVSNALISLGSTNSPIKQRIWTSDHGRFKTYIPIRQALDLNIEDECYTSLRSAQIGPFLSSSDIGDLDIDTGNDYWTISGQLIKCASISEGVENGYTVVSTASHHWIIPVNQGYFSVDIFICSNDFSISGRDIQADKNANGAIIDDLASKPREFYAGIFKACD